MTGTRFLVVNADDFGQSPGVNRGIIQAHERGIVTSASLMVRWPAAVEAASFARNHPALSVGLHFDLGEWFFRGGDWRPLYEVIPLDDEATIGAEVERQLHRFRRLTGRDPTHIDSHQHVHKRHTVTTVARAVADGLDVPLRWFSDEVRYCGDFYGQQEDGSTNHDAISVDGLSSILRSLKPGITELACHPAIGDDVEGMYRTERAIEVATLCDPRVRAELKSLRIELTSFASLPVARMGG